jgi:hypothetical protein
MTPDGTHTGNAGNVGNAGDTEDTGGTADSTGTAGTTEARRRLEQRYRRVLKLLPGHYRTHRGEEMVGVFLDNAAADQKRPGWRETLGVGRLAVRARWSAPPVPMGPGRPARAVALAGTFLFGVNGIVQADFVAAHRRELRRQLAWMNFGHMTPGDVTTSHYFQLYGSPARWAGYTLVLPVLWTLAFVALLGAARRVAAVLALAAAAPMALMPHWWSDRPVQTAMSTLVAACVVAFALGAQVVPDVFNRTAAVLALAATGAIVVGHESREPYFLGRVSDTSPDSPVLWLLAAALFVLAVLLGRLDPAWPLGMAVLGAGPAVAAVATAGDWDGETRRASLGYFAYYGDQILAAEAGLVAVTAAVLVRALLRARRLRGGPAQRMA